VQAMMLSMGSTHTQLLHQLLPVSLPPQPFGTSSPPVRMHMSMSAFGAGKGCGARSSAAAAGVRSTASARSARSACSVDGRARRDGAVIGRSSDCAVCAFCFSFPSAAAA